MSSRPSPVHTVAIVGGGFSGAAIAFHLANATGGKVRIIVFEPRAKLGAGLAYDTDEPAHRINVPASRMSLFPHDEEHFSRWLATDDRALADEEALLPDGRNFPRRSAFGRYVDANMRPLVKAGRIEHVQARVTSAERVGDRWKVATDTLSVLADFLVIATSHPPPAPPAVLRPLAGDPAIVPDPLAVNALAHISRTDRVLIVGTGLTMADMVAALHRRGHIGPITAISRRGQSSHAHGPWPMRSFGDFSIDPARTAVGLLRRIRAVVRDAEASGMTWHAVLDTLRKQGGPIWAALPRAERHRVVRHLRPFWDTHRFRIAPQVDAVRRQRAAEGSLWIMPASLTGARRTEAGIEVLLRPRHAKQAEVRTFDKVIVTIGPSHTTLLTEEPFLAGLARAGFLRGDAVHLGIDCDESSRAIGVDGHPVPSLFIGGPLARGTFGELMGLPEVSRHVLFVAGWLAEALIATPGADAARRSCAVRARSA